MSDILFIISGLAALYAIAVTGYYTIKYWQGALFMIFLVLMIGVITGG